MSLPGPGEESRAIPESAVLRHLPQLVADNEALRRELLASRSGSETLIEQLWHQKGRRADVTARLAEHERWINDLRDSLVWRLIKPLWKLHLHYAKERLKEGPHKSPPTLVFAIDPLEAPGSIRSSLAISGWCYAVDGPEVVGVRAKLGSKSYLARYGLKRLDLAHVNAIHAGPRECGFSMTVPLAPDPSVIRLEAIAQGSPWRCFVECAVPRSRNPINE